MDVNTGQTTRLCVILKAGGLSKNLEGLFPQLSNSEIADLTDIVWRDNQDTLYSPDRYRVGQTIYINPPAQPTSNTKETPSVG